MESKFKLNDTASWYETSELAWRMNEYDEYAVEQAVQLREQIKECDLTVLSIGGDRVKETLKKALAMGCDRAVHIEESKSHTLDPFQIAETICAYAQQQSYDFIFCGMQSQDRGSAQVGPLLAGMLDMPVVTTIVDFSFSPHEVKVKRELEGGIKACISVRGPALFTCQLGLNTPRYPTLPNIMKAKKKEMIVVSRQDLSQTEALQKTAEIRFPEKKGGGIVLEGEPAELAEKVVVLLKEKTSIFA